MSRESIFEKLEEVKKILSVVNEQIQPEEIKQCIQQLANWQYKSKKEKKKIRLSKESVIIYEILIKHSFSPSTVYRWLLLEETSLELTEQLQKRKISQRNASKLKKSQRNQLNVNEKELRDMILFELDRYIEV